MVKYAKPNQKPDFVRYNRKFIITVIVITEFDCDSFKMIQNLFYLNDIFHDPFESQI